MHTMMTLAVCMPLFMPLICKSITRFQEEASMAHSGDKEAINSKEASFRK